MKLTRINYKCDECLFTWRAPIWEPLWVSRLCFKEIHAEQHAQGDGSNHPLVKEWREWEQERIFNVIDDIADGIGWIEMTAKELIKRIKKESK